MGKKRQAPLLKDEWLSPALIAVLADVFERFDVDRDGSWSTEELQAYATACNGEPLDDDELEYSDQRNQPPPKSPPRPKTAKRDRKNATLASVDCAGVWGGEAVNDWVTDFGIESASAESG